jgi:hypothetical protein
MANTTAFAGEKLTKLTNAYAALRSKDGALCT